MDFFLYEYEFILFYFVECTTEECKHVSGGSKYSPYHESRSSGVYTYVIYNPASFHGKYLRLLKSNMFFMCCFLDGMCSIYLLLYCTFHIIVALPFLPSCLYNDFVGTSILYFSSFVFI